MSLTTLHNLEEYRLGFSAAIIHDLFNWCTVIYNIYTFNLQYLHIIFTISTHYIYNIYRCTILVLLPIEIGTGFLEKLTGSKFNLLKLIFIL